MPSLGSNLATVKDAQSTDLSSLLNVLEWMIDGTFPDKIRVDVDLVRKLRSQVRNIWAHAPQLELTDDKTAECFSIATNFLKYLEKVWSHAENRKCLEHLEDLKTNAVTNVIESELQTLLLLRHYIFNDIENESTRSSNKRPNKEHEEELKKLKCALNECSKRIRQLTSCLPDKLKMFTGREAEIESVITCLNEENAVLSLHGGPGFGKTAIAIEVSHKLSEEHNILVIFSQLTTVTTLDDMIRQLCLDAGVKYEDDPKSSLIVWLRNIQNKIIFVMDDIDNLLKENKTNFYEFVRLLRKNSNQHCQIVTTSRGSYEIPELLSAKAQVDEMDDKECMELLKKQCPEQEDEFLRELAKLCGRIPLAMSIAGSRCDEFESSDEILEHLKKQPMKFLECPERDQYVYRAINMSYEKCSDEEKGILVRLAVFEENFSRASAIAVIEKENLDSTNTLKELVLKSLLKTRIKNRYSMHLMIKHFLNEQQEGENKIAKRMRVEAMRAESLKVKYYLSLGHKLTMKSYLKDEYKTNIEALKQEAHHIHNVLKICCQQKDPTTTDIPDCLAKSNVYTTSARYFSLFVRSIIPGPIVDKFLQRCANLAEERDDHAIKINFHCLLAEQERNKSTAKSDQEFNTKMEEIVKEFETLQEDLKQDKSVCAHYYYLYGLHLQRRIKGVEDEKKTIKTVGKIDGRYKGKVN